MTNDIIYAVALILQQIDASTLQIMTEPVKMAMDECVKMAVAINMDDTHPFIMTCTPFAEAVVEAVQ
jgi:hypothetical protein